MRLEAFFTSGPKSSTPVFENSAACVYVETSRRLRPFVASACVRHKTRRLAPETIPGAGDTLSTSSKRRLPSFGTATIFTESLILAQDERWRRA